VQAKFEPAKDAGHPAALPKESSVRYPDIHQVNATVQYVLEEGILVAAPSRRLTLSKVAPLTLLLGSSSPLLLPHFSTLGAQ
jgi:hypothetical protein